MTKRRTQSRADKLIRLGGAAFLIAVLVARVKRGARRPEMAAEPTTTVVAATSGLAELKLYIVGYVLALALTIAAFVLVYSREAPPTTTLAIVLGLALVQILVHFRCFLHVTFDRSARDDLQLILFSTLIVLLMVGGTLVVLFNLRMRMM